MTVKQLRDWLIKQDETAEIRIRPYIRPYNREGESFTDDFYIMAVSTVFSQQEAQS